MIRRFVFPLLLAFASLTLTAHAQTEVSFRAPTLKNGYISMTTIYSVDSVSFPVLKVKNTGADKESTWYVHEEADGYVSIQSAAYRNRYIIAYSSTNTDKMYVSDLTVPVHHTCKLFKPVPYSSNEPMLIQLVPKCGIAGDIVAAVGLNLRVVNRPNATITKDTDTVFRSTAGIYVPPITIDLPVVVSQNDNWSCGPNSATRFLNFYGKNVTLGRVMSTSRYNMPDELVMTELGTVPNALHRTLLDFSYNATLRSGNGGLDEIVNIASQRKPVIVLLMVDNKTIPVAQMGKGTILGGLLDKIGARPNVTITIPTLHWVNVRGVDKANKRIYIQDTKNNQYSLSYDEFLGKWNWVVGAGATKTALDNYKVYGRTYIF